jgi:MoaA/NifB/PqqE/SkfB family radical SAM enzyme
MGPGLPMISAASDLPHQRVMAHKERLQALPRPIPSAGAEAYARERELALAWDPRRRANYEAYLAASANGRTATLDYLPVKLDIENVSRCNFRCTMCQVTDWPHGKRAGDLPLPCFKRLIDEQYGLVEIKLQGMGEPLLQRGDYFEMIAYARRSHIWVRTTTNASLLHLKSNYKRLIDVDPNEVQISIDGATAATFEGIRRQSDFDRVVTNCVLINDYCRAQGVRRTKMWMVVQKANVHEVREILELAHRIGFEDLVYSVDLNFWGQDSWQAANTESLAEDRMEPALCEELAARGAELGIRVSFWIIMDKFSTTSPRSLCPWPFERAFVSSDERVVPCCMIANPEVLDLGGAEDFSATWHSKAYGDFRQAHIDGRIPKACMSCYDRNGR